MIIICTRGGPRPPGGIPRQSIRGTGAQRTVDSYFPFVPGSEPMAVVQDALNVIEERTSPEAILSTCDQAFRNIAGIPFSNLFYGDTPTVAIFRNPTNPGGQLALTFGQGFARHVTLSPLVYSLNNQAGISREELVLRCAATLLHEFAHCAGAPGQPSRAAEDTLLACGFQDRFNPAAVG